MNAGLHRMAGFRREDWRSVLWTDESYMSADGPHRRYVTRRKSQLYSQDCLQPKIRHPTSVMIWGSISGAGTGPMVIWEKDWGTVTAQSYCEHTVPVAAEYLKAFPELIFMHDLAPGHKAKLTQEALKKAGFLMLPWPANSPDLNPIEGLWQNIKERLYRMPHKPTKREELEQCIIELWNNIGQETVLKHIDSLPERIQAVIAAGGGHTKW